VAANLAIAPDTRRCGKEPVKRVVKETGVGHHEDMATATPQRPGLRAHAEAIRLDTPVLVKALRDLLGAKLVAYLGGVRETRAVRQWAEGARTVQDKTDEHRLRLAYQVASLIAEHDEADVVQPWFQGLNPQLDDRSPARMLREGELDEVGSVVLAAARTFAATG
jgi:hypothetical protein